MRKRLFIALIIILMLIPTGIALAEKPITFTTEYEFVAFNPFMEDSEGRVRTWAGTIDGDYTGEIEWWMHLGPDDMRPTGKVSHWEDAYWIIYPDVEDPGEERPYISGLEWGSTTARPVPGKTGFWRANGIVNWASEEFEYLIGLPIHDGGEFTWVINGDLPAPDSGWGRFRIH